MSESFAWAPIGRLLGLEVQPGEPGVAEVLLDVDQRLHNPMGFVHGGVIALLADAAMGVAFGRTIGEEEEQHAFSTIELKTSFLRPIKQGRLRAEARLVGRGLRIGFGEATVTDQRGKLIATASCSFTITTL